MNTKNTMKSMRASLKLGLLAPLTLASLSVAPHARADSILLAQTTLVSGTESEVDSFTTSGAGKVTVSLQGLDWKPTALAALSFSATSASNVLASANGTGLTSENLTFDVSGPGTYFAHIMATAAGPLDLGLYSLLMTFAPTSPVPLPASDWMLLTGMFVLAGLARMVRRFDLPEPAGA